MQTIEVEVPSLNRTCLRWANDSVITLVETQLIIQIDNNLPLVAIAGNHSGIHVWHNAKNAKNTRKMRLFAASFPLVKATPYDANQLRAAGSTEQTFRLFTCVDNLNLLEFDEVYFL
jgi:hypothetical protein